MGAQELEHYRRALVAFLNSPEGRQRASTALRRRRVTADVTWVDDVVQQAIVRVLRRFSDGEQPPDEPFSAAAYGTTVLRSAVADLFAGRIDDVPIDESDLVSVEVGRARADDADGVDFVDLVRLGIEEHTCAPAWIVSAAFTYVTLAAHPEAMDAFSELPLPRRGADVHQRLWWPALALAGRVDLVTESADRNVQRKRQRAADKASSLCQRAAATARSREVQAHG